MPEVSVLFDQLERRARAVRALFYAGVTSISGGAVVLIAAILSVIISRPIPHAELAVIGTLIVFGVVGFLLGLRLPIHLPTILLRADVALGLDAKLSTLYDIRNRPDKKLFAARIAAKLPSTPPHPHRAFPIRVREVSLLGAAIALAITAIMVSGIPKQSGPSSGVRSEASISTVPEAIDGQPVGEATNGAAIEAEIDAEIAGDPSDSEDAETLSLSDILTTIRPTPLTGTISGDEFDADSLRSRPRSDVSLDVVLRQIEENLLQDGAQALSPADIATLEAFRNFASSDVARALERILEASTHSETLERIAQVFEDTQLFDTSQRLTLSAEEQDNIQDVAGNRDVADDSPSLMLDTSTEQEGQLVFVETTLPSAEGDEGEFTYYLTKGVPIEPPSEPRESSYEDLELSYEQIESIVSGRALAPDVLDTVKAYFDRIAGGGS